MEDVPLPLPIPYGEMQTGTWSIVEGYTADQMLAYAAQCVAAERERCAKLCESRERAWLAEADRHDKAGELKLRDLLTRQAYGNGEAAAAIRA